MTDPSDADDAELRRRLSQVDPARSLPPADPTRVARLLEDVMSTELTTETRETGTHGRSPLTWLVAAAAALVIGGTGLFAVLNGDDTPEVPPTATGTAGSTPGSTPSGPSTGSSGVTELQAPDPAAYTARCMVPNAQVLGQATVAVDATVTGISDDTVTLTVDEWYAGEPTEQVQVQAPAAQMQDLLGAVSFVEGERYLLSATNGQVSVCGFSAPYSAGLATLYAEAFPG